MKTENLIEALVADAPAIERPIARTIGMAITVGAVLAAVVFMATTALRPDIATLAVRHWEIALKFVFTIAIAVPAALLLVRRLARPDGGDAAIGRAFVAPVALIAAAVAFELARVGPDLAPALLMHPNWTRCLVAIPVFSLAPLIAVLYALRRGAPANPALAGGVGGLLSGAIGATLYAAHCNADSPLFVGAWYSLAILAMGALGALIGSRLLRW